MLTPFYCALLEASLDYDGLIGPSVSPNGRFTYDSGRDLLKDDDGVTLICQALMRADAAVCTTTGRQVLQALAESVGVNGGVKAVYDDLCGEGHVFSNNSVETVLHDAVRAFAIQLGN